MLKLLGFIGGIILCTCGHPIFGAILIVVSILA